MPPYSKNAFGLTWFKNGVECTGALELARKYRCDDEVLVFSETKKHGRMWSACTPAQLCKLTETNHGIYEILSDYPHKLYFDLDKKGNHKEYLAEALAIIEKEFPGADCAISGSITEEKTSFHVAVQNYVIHNEQERNAVPRIVGGYDGFDIAVYTKNRNMKCINQSKLDGRIQAPLGGASDGAWSKPERHLISCFVAPGLPIPISIAIAEAIQPKVFDMGILADIKYPAILILDEMTPLEIMHALPLTVNDQFLYINKVLRFALHNDVSFQEFLKWGHQRCLDDVKWAEQWARNEKYNPPLKQTLLYMVKHFYPNAVWEKDKHFTAFRDTFVLPATEKVETLTQACFTGPEKFICLNTGMGSGKTAQVIQFLDAPKTATAGLGFAQKKGFVWISPNIALARNLGVRMDATFYKDISQADKKKGIASHRLLICQNSLHYVTKKYKIVVIDESETVLMKWMGDFMDQKTKGMKAKNWEKFVELIRNADRVIVMDAFTTTKTIDFLKSISDEPIRIIERLNEPKTRKVVYVKQFENMIHKMKEERAQGKRIFVFYPQKHQAKRISMAGLADILSADGSKGIFYNSEVDEQVKEGLRDVNETWKDLDFVITNTTISCGVNYDLPHYDFDTVFMYVANYTQPRDGIQCSYRPRALTSGNIFVNFMDNGKPREVWADDAGSMGCPIYKSLYQANLLELKAPNKKTFALFCSKAGYEQTEDDREFSEDLALKTKEMLDKYATVFAYKGLEDITSYEVEALKEKMFLGTITMREKFLMGRFFFQTEFRFARRGDALVEEMWDKQLVRFVDKVQRPNYVFTQIAKANNFTGFPEDLTKVKLNDELLDEIFKEFSFKDLTRTSKASNILRNIYNEEFGFIYKSVCHGNKNYSYELDEDVNNYYDFIKMASTRKQCACPGFCMGEHGLCGTCAGYKPEKVIEVEFEDDDDDFRGLSPAQYIPVATRVLSAEFIMLIEAHVEEIVMHSGLSSGPRSRSTMKIERKEMNLPSPQNGRTAMILPSPMYDSD